MIMFKIWFLIIIELLFFHDHGAKIFDSNAQCILTAFNVCPRNVTFRIVIQQPFSDISLFDSEHSLLLQVALNPDELKILIDIHPLYSKESHCSISIQELCTICGLSCCINQQLQQSLELTLITSPRTLISFSGRHSTNNCQQGNPVSVESLEQLYKIFNASFENHSLTKKYLTKPIVERYQSIATSTGSTLSHCVRNSAYNPNAICPRAGDAECYSVFQEYLDRIIMDYHGVSNTSFRHPNPDYGDLDNLPFGDLDPSGEFIISTRVRVGRSVKGFNFAPTIGKVQRIKLEAVIIKALKSLFGELSGQYYPLMGMSEGTMKRLVEDHFLFKDDDKVLRDAGGYRDWPSGRGIFHNKMKTFLVWVNEEDHIRIISMEAGGNVAGVYRRLIQGIRALEKKLSFVHSEKYGYLTCCPSNLGTTMRASVHIKIPKLSSNKAKFAEICKKYNLQARGFHGEHTESVGGVYDISNRRRLGLTEIQALEDMAKGVSAIIDIEKSL